MIERAPDDEQHVEANEGDQDDDDYQPSDEDMPTARRKQPRRR